MKHFIQSDDISIMHEFCINCVYRYGGFSLGSKSSQGQTSIHQLEQSVMAIRKRYKVAQVCTLTSKAQ